MNLSKGVLVLDSLWYGDTNKMRSVVRLPAASALKGEGEILFLCVVQEDYDGIVGVSYPVLAGIAHFLCLHVDNLLILHYTLDMNAKRAL